ncbi:MAG: tRNA epoxyqueuosine(34) reductase QueG [Anaerolineales bacterium]
MELLKESLRKRARELGFVHSGFTTAEPPDHYPAFANWIAAGRQAGMDYLAAERSLSMRAIPTRLLPSARSIIALAMPYPPPPDFENLPLEGRVAAYAQGADYHEIIPDRLRLLCRDLDSLAGGRLQHRAYVDTGPILEREIASRAGLGWIGRNSMLIHPAIGSFFFLAVILTELELPPDPPFAFDRCGTCDRCLKACPTGCILPDRTIDSGRCISYWTIEHRGSVPDDVRIRIGRWVFGCDICQIVCPWNRKNHPEAESSFRSRPHFPIRNVARETALSEEEWQARFYKSPLRRTGREGYLRNLIIVLGNTRREEAIPFLLPFQSNQSPVLRDFAGWAIKQING